METDAGAAGWDHRGEHRVRGCQEAPQSGYNLVEGIPPHDQAEDEKMKPTDIPNGYVVKGPAGRNILVDFDDKGKAENQAAEVTIAGWPDSIMLRGVVRHDVLVLVHSVKGEGEMLVKRLLASQLALDGKPISVDMVAKRGQLTKMAEKVYADYMRERTKLDNVMVAIDVAEKAELE